MLWLMNSMWIVGAGRHRGRGKAVGRGSDHGADLHYGENNNGFPSARVNSQQPEDDHHLHGVHDRFDDDVPSIDAETIAGRGDKALLRSPLRP